MLFERIKGGNVAILVHIDFPEGNDREDPLEFEELVTSAGIEPADLVTAKRHRPHPKFFIGSGKLEDIKVLLASHEADLVLFNHALSPSQERNIEAFLECRVIDRTGLILEIFAQRARTHEGKLQVELAQLGYQSTRLVRGWTHLERQKGGVNLRGAGETQIEMDRRMIQQRIDQIRKQLRKVETARLQNRRARERSETPSLALVGYTNAGKSTLFNALTQSEVYAADQLFATLDPTLRRLHIPDYGPVVLADTVGFIRHLPHKLVEAFKATLQETRDADLLLHVIDVASEDRQEHIEQVDLVLEEIEAQDVPCLQVYNKIDLIRDFSPMIERDDQGRPLRVWVSAQKKLGFDLLMQAVAELVGEELFDQSIQLGPELGQLRALLHDARCVKSEEWLENGELEIKVKLPLKEFRRLLSKAGLDPIRFLSATEKEHWE